MSGSCAIPTPKQRIYHEIQTRAENLLDEKVSTAISEITEQFETQCRDAGFSLPPGYSEYFAAYLNQKLFLRLCKADPVTFEGGQAHIAAAIIKNCCDIANRHWASNMELRKT